MTAQPDIRTSATASDTEENTVRLDGDGLLIRSLRSTDAVVLAGARRAAATGAPLETWAASALAVGAQAIDLAGPVAAVDAVSRRVDALADKVAAAAETGAARLQAAVERASDERDGSVAVAVRTALERLAADVSGLVADEDAPLRKAVARSVHDATGLAAARVERALADNTAAVRAALSPTDPAGPVESLRREVRAASEATRRELGDRLAEVSTLVAVAREHSAVLERSSAKGVPYERAVCDAVSEIALAAGDLLEPTGSDVGLVAHAKSGDAVVTLAASATGGAAVRVVVEAKDSTLSAARWRAELDAGLRNRGAHAALGVVRSADRMPGGRRRIALLDATRCVVAWDPAEDPADVLAAAYALVRASAAAAANAAAGDDDAERELLARAVRETYDALSGWDALDKAAGTARRGLDDLTRASTALRESLHAHLARGLRAAGPSR